MAGDCVGGANVCVLRSKVGMQAFGKAQGNESERCVVLSVVTLLDDRLVVE